MLYDGAVAVDALGYGEFAPGEIYAGEGMPAPDPPAGSSLARVFADVDSDDNLLDFEVLAEPTPGSAELHSVPEPGSATLGIAGLLGLAALGRRRPARRG
ncbi:MAG: PEP-CTERM sorting domain-containing protein [Deltaproteobacteria bacterium]|nr:PEP-CTERM sorting domain-containing protein [Deltaproteobacteria bacterium]MBW2417850.1 PEP-CTERM sorting domain-containing protein [Deltaproteobacteria bacterium]